MSIPQVHEGLESILGHTNFSGDIQFWNSVITDVTVEDHEDQVDLGTYYGLRNRYVVSTYIMPMLKWG